MNFIQTSNISVHTFLVLIFVLCGNHFIKAIRYSKCSVLFNNTQLKGVVRHDAIVNCIQHRLLYLIAY